MIDVMHWEVCKREFIRDVFADKEKVLSMKEMAKERLSFIKQQEATHKNVSFIVE